MPKSHRSPIHMTTILYIDDEPLVADASVRFLTHSGFEVDKALSGREALEKLRAGRYDAVISDYHMPGMTGIELLKIIRSDIGDIPFILFTGKGREEVVIEAIEHGVDYYVQKGGTPGPLFADLTHKINIAIQRRESERLLRINEKRLRKAQEIGKIGCWEHAVGSDVLWMSEEALRLYGMDGPSRNVLISDIFACIREQDKVEKAFRNLIETRADFHIEYSIIPVNNTAPRILLSIASVEEDDPGTGRRIVGITQDITEKKNSEWRLTKKNADLTAALDRLTNAEEKLTHQLEEIRAAHEKISESEEKYRKLFEENIVGTAVHEIICNESGAPVDYRFLDVNPAFEQITGLVGDEIRNKTVLEVLPDTEPYWIDIYGRVALTGKPAHFEQFSRELQKYFEVFAYAPQIGQFVTLFQDITERRRRENSLNELNAYLENLFVYSNVPIIVWDPEGIISRINHSFEILIGRPRDEVIGKPLDILFPERDAEYAMRLIQTTRDGVRWETVEIPILHADGTIRVVIWNSATIYAADGKSPIATIAQGRDITGEKLLEKEKQQAMNKIQENIAKLAILNDGIRNPLTIISTYADMADDDDIAKNIHAEVMRIDAMVNTLDKEWVSSEKILNYLRKQDKITPDFKPVLSEAQPDFDTRLSTPSGQEHILPVVSSQNLFIEEIQAQLYAILDSIDAFVYVADMETYDILYMNERGRALFGNVHGQKCYSHIRAHSEGPCPYCTNHLLLSNQKPTGVCRWEFHDPKTGRWYDCRDRAIRWSDGRLVRLEIATDITDLKKSEEAYKKAEERIRMVFDNIPDGIIVADVKTKRFVFVNEAMSRMLGTTREDLIGHTTAEIHPVYALPSVMSEFEKMRSGVLHFVSNIPVQRKDGSIFFADINSSLLELDGQKTLLGVFHDCSDRIRSDEENKLHMLRLQTFLTLLRMVDASEMDILNYSLKQSLYITKSLYAFIGTLSADESEMIIHSWSEGAMDMCQVRDKPLHFPIDKAGIWGECIRNRTSCLINDYSLPHHAKHGYPEGHIDITRFLGMPVFDGDRIVAILAVANKESDYRDDDIDALQTLGTMTWEIIRRKRAEEEISRQNEALSSAYEEIRSSEEELRHNYEELEISRQKILEREKELRLKLETILTPEHDISEEEFANIIDSHELQILMDDFYALTHIGIAILDLKGNILVATGWQDICTKFHRVHEESCKNCIESDLYLTRNVKAGEYLVYKCKNNMWDMVTPIIIGNRHMGNLFLGQFFFDDEVPDRDVFSAQAERFGFDKDEYLAALDRVPRWSKSTVTTIMDFYTRFSSLISRLSYSNITLARSLLDQKRLHADLEDRERRLSAIIQNSPAGYFRIDRNGNYQEVNDAWLMMHRYHDRSEVIGHHFSITQVDTSQEAAQKNFERLLSGEPIPSGEFTRRCRDGTTGIHSFSAIPVMENGEITGIEGFLIDITNRKMIEDDLKRSEQEYWWLLESMINAFVMFESVFDDDGRFISYRFLYINRAYENITGVRFHDVYGKTVHEVWPDTEDEWIQRYGEVAVTGIPSEFDLFHAPTNKAYHCHVYRPWNDTRRFCVIFEDITKRKEAEETLQESRDLLDATQKLTRIGGWEWHVQRQTMTWTTETYQIHDIDPGSITPGSPEHITKSISCYDPEDRPVIQAAFERCVTEGVPYDLVFPFTTMKGRRIWIRTTAEPVLADGKVIRVIGNIMDITDQKLAEAALHESQEKYRLIAENTADNIWIIDMDLKMQYSSPSVWKMKGFTVEETLAQSITDMMTPASVEKVLKLFHDEMEAELAGTADPNRTISFDTEEYCKDGSVIIVENSATLLRDEQGRPTGILGISRDITERKKMQDALVQSNKKLRLLTSLTRHDILNLISSVNEFLDLANSEDDPEKARYYLSLCKEAGERMEDTIGFTREYENFGIVSSGWVNVSSLVRSARSEIPLTDVSIESLISPTLEIFADPIIRKVFSTLIENAIRHGKTLSYIRFAEEIREGACIIICEDDGIGIPGSDKEHIFDHGFGKHTGIGLFLSREILSITDLSICECGEEGKGARFEITVPAGKFRINGKTGL